MRGSCTERQGRVDSLARSLSLSLSFSVTGQRDGGGSEVRGEFSTRLVSKHVGRRVSEKGRIGGDERGCSYCRGGG